ncbi:MAG TPA: SCO family protein, partial [Arenicellales bacterium]|nr:SCO family protein [Arenicellales bacterium]
TLTVLGRVLQTLDASELDDVQVLFISLDPERDLPPRMAEYSAFFHPKIRGLTGTAAQIAQVAKQYGVLYQAVPAPDSALGYSVDHSGVIYVLGRSGGAVALIQHGSPADEVLKIVREVLAR